MSHTCAGARENTALERTNLVPDLSLGCARGVCPFAVGLGVLAANGTALRHQDFGFHPLLFERH